MVFGASPAAVGAGDCVSHLLERPGGQTAERTEGRHMGTREGLQPDTERAQGSPLSLVERE